MHWGSLSELANHWDSKRICFPRAPGLKRNGTMAPLKVWQMENTFMAETDTWMLHTAAYPLSNWFLTMAIPAITPAAHPGRSATLKQPILQKKPPSCVRSHGLYCAQTFYWLPHSHHAGSAFVLGFPGSNTAATNMVKILARVTLRPRQEISTRHFLDEDDAMLAIFS